MMQTTTPLCKVSPDESACKLSFPFHWLAAYRSVVVLLVASVEGIECRGRLGYCWQKISLDSRLDLQWRNYYVCIEGGLGFHVRGSGWLGDHQG